MIYSLNSLVSPQVVLTRDLDAGRFSEAIYRAFATLFSGKMVGCMEDSQPTRCGHTLRGIHCRGWRVACAPSNPAQDKRRVTP